MKDLSNYPKYVSTKQTSVFGKKLPIYPLVWVGLLVIYFLTGRLGTTLQDYLFGALRTGVLIIVISLVDFLFFSGKDNK